MKARLWFVHKGIEKLFEGRDPPIRHPARRTSLRRHRDRPQPRLLPRRRRRPRRPGTSRRTTGSARSSSNSNGSTTTPPTSAHSANDVGYGILNAHALRIREQLLRLNQRVTGHRLLRGAIVPGGAHVLDLPEPDELIEIATDLAEIACSRSRTPPWSTDSPAHRYCPPNRRRRSERSATSPARRRSTSTPAATIPSSISAQRSTSSSTATVTSWHDSGVRRDEFANSVELIRWLLDQLSGRHGEPAIAPIPVATEPSFRRRNRRSLARHPRPPSRARPRTRPHPRQDRRPLILQLARAPRSPPRHHRPRLPARQQELQPLLRRQRSLTPRISSSTVAGRSWVNKRLARQALTMFCAVNGHDLVARVDEAHRHVRRRNNPAVARIENRRVAQTLVKASRARCLHGLQRTVVAVIDDVRRATVATVVHRREHSPRVACPFVPLEPVPVACPS